MKESKVRRPVRRTASCCRRLRSGRLPGSYCGCCPCSIPYKYLRNPSPQSLCLLNVETLGSQVYRLLVLSVKVPLVPKFYHSNLLGLRRTDTKILDPCGCVPVVLLAGCDIAWLFSHRLRIVSSLVHVALPEVLPANTSS